MIRILAHGVSSNLGGIERYLVQLVRALDDSEFHVDITHSDTGALPALCDEFAALGCAFHPVTPRRQNARRNRRELANLMRSGRFDLLHFNAMSASYLAPVRASLEARMPVVVHSHSAGGEPSMRSRALHRLGRMSPALPRTTRVAVSDAAGRWMFGNLPWEVVPNGVDLATFSFDPRARARLREELDLADCLVLGHVGGFFPAKNHQFLLDALAEVLRDRLDPVLLLIGEGPLERTIRVRAQEMGIDGHIRFLGQRTDVRDLLSAVDLFVFPSSYEGSPLAVVEARAAGLPVLVSTAVPRDLSDRSTMRMPLSAGPTAWARAILSTSIHRDPLASDIPSVQDNATMMADVFRRAVHTR